MLCFWCKTKAILRAWMLLKGTGTCGVPEISETFNFRRPKVPFFHDEVTIQNTNTPGLTFFLIFVAFTHQWSIHLERIDDDRHSHLSFGSSWAQKKTHRHFKLRSGSNRHVLLSQRCIITYQDAWMYPYFMINWAVPTWWKPRITTELPRNLHTSQDFAAGVAWHRCRGVVCLAWWEKQAWKVTRKAHW